MAVVVYLANGDRRALASNMGATVAEVVNRQTDQTLTGSAVVLEEVLLDTDDGGKVRFGDVKRWTIE